MRAPPADSDERGQRRAPGRILRCRLARGRSSEKHARILPPRSELVRRLARAAGPRHAAECDRSRSRRVFRLALLAAFPRKEARHPLEHPGAAALEPEALLRVRRARAARRDRSYAQARSPPETAARSKNS